MGRNQAGGKARAQGTPRKARPAVTQSIPPAAAAPILDKIEEEIGELREALRDGKKSAVADELGDLIFALVNIGRHVGADPEMALRGTNTKFRNRFSHIEDSLAENGESLEEATLERMEELWQAAKRIERQLGE